MKQMILFSLRTLALATMIPSLYLWAEEGGEGMIIVDEEFEKIESMGHHTGPTAQSRDIKEMFFTRLIHGRRFKTDNKELELLVEPRSPERAAIGVLKDGERLPAGAGYDVLAAKGIAGFVQFEGDERKKVAEGQSFEDALASKEGWEKKAFEKSSPVAFKECWVYRTYFNLPEATSPLTAHFSFSGHCKARTSIWLNNTTVKQAQWYSYEGRVVLKNGLKQGRNELAFRLDNRQPIRNSQKTRDVKIGLVMVQGSTEVQVSTRGSDPLYLLHEAMRMYPKTTLLILAGRNLLARAVVDFNLEDALKSGIQFSELLEATSKHGFCLPRDGKYQFEDGTQGWFFGGHENHPPSHETTDAYVETCKLIGANTIRIIPLEELVRDRSTGELDPELLERMHYFVYRLGQGGIYVHLTLTSYGEYSWENDPGGLPEGCYEREWIKEEKKRTLSEKKGVTDFARITHPRLIELDQKYFGNLLTSVSPYTGLRMVDDPTIMGIEIANEVGLGGRTFDWYDQTDPPAFEYRMKLWGDYLVSKYGPADGCYYKDYPLYKQWYKTSFYKWEMPGIGHPVWPSGFTGNRHLGAVNGAWYLDGTARLANPRISDAMEHFGAIEENWLSSHAKFLTQKLGVRVGIGCSSDGFQIYQVGSRRANARSLNVTDGHAYGGAGQIFRGFGGWDGLRQNNYVYGRPAYAREWGVYWRQGNYPWEYILLAAVVARVNGYDGFANHKFGPFIYPTRDPKQYRASISPFSDQRRGAYALGCWILKRSKIEEPEEKILIGFPKDDVLYGGANSAFANSLYTSWLQDQLQTEEYHFDEVYDGPKDRIVFHDGRGPHGDYRNARHAILWSHGKSDRFAQDEHAKEKWLALHGIQFKEGEKYILTDKYLACSGDIHADPAFGDKLYEALVKWNYPVPYAREEISRLWRNREKNIEINFSRCAMTVDRNDVQAWMGRFEGKGKEKLSRLEVASDEKQMDVVLIPFDTADFASSKRLLLWCMWDAEIDIKLPFRKPPDVYAVNWLGYRLYKVKPVSFSDNQLSLKTARDEDIFFYEIVR